MGTSAYRGRTTVTEWKDIIRKLGGTPKGKTVAQLQDEYEQLIGSGSGGSVDVTEGRLEPSDIDDIFGGEG